MFVRNNVPVKIAVRAAKTAVGEQIHLLSLNDTHKLIEEPDCSDSDDDMEVASNLDTEENDLIHMSTYSRIDSSGASDNNNHTPFTSTRKIGSAFSRSDSKNDDNPADST